MLLFLLGQAINDVDLDVLLVEKLFPRGDELTNIIRILSWTQLFVALLVPSSVARTVTFVPIIE